MIEVINALPDEVRNIEAVYTLIRMIAVMLNLRFWEDGSVSID